MKYYLIYNKKGKFLGFADDKKYLKNFIKNRKGSYKICKLDKEEVPDDIEELNAYDDYRLTEYIGYQGYSDTVLFGYEYFDVERCMTEDSLRIQETIDNLLELMKLIRFDDKEKVFITYIFDQVLLIVADTIDSSETIYDEAFDIKKYFYERYLKELKTN